MDKNYNRRDRQLLPAPWKAELSKEMKEGSIIKGRIVAIKDYGALLEITPGIEGLILLPEITWSNQKINIRAYFKLNQECHAKIIWLDRDNKRMYLSIKQMTDDPWSKITKKYPPNSRHTGLVKYLAPFGVFVELEDGIGGMIHLSNLSWTKKYTHPSEFTQQGQSIEVVILNIDAINRQIALGHKQLKEKPVS